MQVGIVSDSHGRLPDRAKELLLGCSLIFHAGDIGSLALYEELSNIAPTKAVRGNADGEDLSFLPTYLTTKAGPFSVCMAHKKKDLPEDYLSYDLVITGHTHRYRMEKKGSVTLLNPGSCAVKRAGQMLTLALAEVGPSGLLITGKKYTEDAPPKEGEERKVVEKIMSLTRRNESIATISQKLSLPSEYVERVVRLIVTHPGVDIEGVLRRMGL